MDINGGDRTVLNASMAAATVAALAGRATASAFVDMATKLADATQGTHDEAVYRALADKMPQEDGLWYETPVGYELAKQIVLGDLDNNAGIDHLH
ncbi:hypothetical protein NR402_11985 [Acidithiobacillus ferrooxidans]|uniref:hypothetical protein n=1 Tax=Acidithiobacillus ferrooxidans TaxID=920 RepID=UPI00214C4B94|nr:hypothetical protein [Acidithiobacillus ferrooxidans]MCR2830994.1 hypothetical protein [Acidithiobacillus ferrooxidans]